MSLKNSSSSTSASPSPSPDVPSNNTSPALINTPLTSKQSDTPASPTHTNTHISIPRSSSTGKGGCWTCRLRRKKCDEIRQGDSCHTCNRLKIKCLGWGTKRPEWMRDKQQVEAYKADIKAQLTRAGMIRGQPRSSMLQASTSSSSVFPTQQYRASASGSHLPQLNNDSSHTFTDIMQPQILAESPTIMSMYANSPFDMPLSLYGDPYPQLNTHSPSPYTPSTSLSSPHLNNLHSLEPTFDTISPTLAFDPDATAPPLSSQSMQPDHVLYYFEHIRKLFFAFAGNSAANIIYSLVLQDPQGPLTNAICALASLHNMRVRAARGLEPMNHTLENSRAIMFYDTAHAQLYKNRQVLLSEADAIAALHLLGFSQCSGGVTDWRTMLDIANEWMVQTGVTTHESPKLAMMNMSPASRLAFKATMWLDVMSTITLHSTPKHLPFYRRLYRGGGGGFWSATGQYNSEELGLRVDSVMGCPDEVILGIAEISHLACWKAQEMRKGSLSMRELIRRGDVIERHLRTQGEPVYLVDSDQTQLHPDLAIGGDANATGLPGVVDGTRQLVGSIFRETAVLYLHTVLSDAKPGVPEIIKSIDIIIQMVHQLPVSILDRALIFPICLAGCLTDDAIRREIFKSRLIGQDGFGNASQALRVLETSWQRRDTRGGPVEWRDLLHVQGRDLLLLV